MVGVKTPLQEESIMIEKIEIKNFTAFDEIAIALVPGVNLFIGDNGTGKTHLLKLLYSFQTTEIVRGLFKEFSRKLSRMFLPQGHSLKRLVRRGKGTKKKSFISITKNGEKLTCTLTGNNTDTKLGVQHLKPDKSVYIPVKEMLANAPGFRSLYSTRETHFEEEYFDIIDKAFLPPLKNVQPKHQKLLKLLQKEMGGKVKAKNEVFFLKSRAGEIEFTLVAEGIRKLALLWLLIRNGSLDKGATLYWDEPEANLNPSMMPVVVKALLSLEQMGVQVIIATHSYVLLKEFELQHTQQTMCFYSLFKDEANTVKLHKASTYQGLFPNKIAEENTRLYDMEIERALGGKNG